MTAFAVIVAFGGAELAHRVDVEALLIPIILVRLAALWIGTRIEPKWGGASSVEKRYDWLGRGSQAGETATVSRFVSPNPEASRQPRRWARAVAPLTPRAVRRSG